MRSADDESIIAISILNWLDPSAILPIRLPTVGDANALIGFLSFIGNLGRKPVLLGRLYRSDWKSPVCAVN
jgi:hypothetical protein